MHDDIEDAINGNRYEDYKSKLQECLQKTHAGEISYEIIKEEGQAHLKTFTVKVMLDKKTLGKGSGHTKKEAEQQAARMALEGLK